MRGLVGQALLPVPGSAIAFEQCQFAMSRVEITSVAPANAVASYLTDRQECLSYRSVESGLPVSINASWPQAAKTSWPRE